MKCFIGAEDAKVLFEIKRDSRSVHFSDVALINVGITTGSNRFSLSLSTTTPLTSMNWIVAMPPIGRSSRASRIRFEEHDWKENRAVGKRSRLLVLKPNQYGMLNPVQHAVP